MFTNYMFCLKFYYPKQCLTTRKPEQIIGVFVCKITNIIIMLSYIRELFNNFYSCICLFFCNHVRCYQ